MKLRLPITAYGSTGNQPTLAASCVDLEQVARGFGFTNTLKPATEKKIKEAMKDRRRSLRFVHVLAVPGNKDVPNIPIHHLEKANGPLEEPVGSVLSLSLISCHAK